MMFTIVQMEALFMEKPEFISSIRWGLRNTSSFESVTGKTKWW
jgi:hypothetical protein